MQKIKALSLSFYLFSLLILPTQSAFAEDTSPFYFAVSAMASPAQTFVHFAEFQDYLESKIGRPVYMKQRRTYEEINNLLYSSTVQMAFTCTGGYLAGRQSFGLETLAVPIVNGKTSYRSYIITSLENPAQNLADLKGSVFAFTDPLSLSGRLYPVATINSHGFRTKVFFKKTFYTASHDKSIEAVATGLADGAAVDSLIYDSLYKMPDSFARKVRVIQESEEFGMPPVVVAPDLDKKTRRTLLKVLLGMDKDPQGKIVLKQLDMNGFALPTPELYHSALILRKQIKE